MNGYISRTEQCTDCRRYGTHVDTTAGEITQHGEVIGHAPEGDLHLMVDIDGDLRCSECSNKKGGPFRVVNAAGESSGSHDDISDAVHWARRHDSDVFDAAGDCVWINPSVTVE